MRLTKEGIGWLIFGVLVVCSCTEADSVVSALSTIALGGVFILLYLLKQFFIPDGIGWYICGGVLVAFCIESGYNSDTLISLILGMICLFVFYTKNKADFDELFSGAAMGYRTDPFDDFSHADPDTYYGPDEEESVEETVEIVEETTVTTEDAADASDTASKDNTAADNAAIDAPGVNRKITEADESNVLVEIDLDQKK